MILVLWSSPNDDGLTAAAKDAVLAGLSEAGQASEAVKLNALKLEHCRACGRGWGTCRKTGTCVIGDDFAALYERMVKADGLVFVSAVYWHDLTEQFKALIDRLRRCEALTNHYLSGKSCLLAACAGGTGRGAVNCLWNLEDSLSHMGMKAVDRLPVVQFNRGYMLDALHGAGRTFGDYLAGRVQFPNLP